MAISLVGTPQAFGASGASNITLTFSTTPLSDDVVVVWGGVGIRYGVLTPPGSGYTQIALNNSMNSIQVGAWYKRMGGTPDTDVLCYGNTYSGNGTAYGCYVLRGVDPITALDVAAFTYGPISASPDCQSITTLTPGAWVLALAGCRTIDTSIGTIVNYSDHIEASYNNGVSYPIVLGGARRSVTPPGGENPSMWSHFAGGLYYAITVALRPAANTFVPQFTVF